MRNFFFLFHMSTFTQNWRCVTHMELVSLRNKLWSIRLVWVTAVALQLLLNDKYKLESLQEDGSRTRQEIPQTAGCKAGACGLQLWKIDTLVSFNRRRRMKAESRQIPQKLAARLKFVYCLRSVERIPATTVFRKCWHLLKELWNRKWRIDELSRHQRSCVWNKE